MVKPIKKKVLFAWPLTPQHFPEGDVDTLRSIYDKDKDILEQGYTRYKDGLVNAHALGLPETFRELLDQEQGQREGDDTPATFPTSIYMGTLRTASYVYEDTESAKTIIEWIDKGDLPLGERREWGGLFDPDTETTPADVSAHVLEEAEAKEENISGRLAGVWLSAELFINPGRRVADMIKHAKTEEEKGKLEDFLRPIVEKDYQLAARKAARATKSKPSDVRDPAKRTEEQYRILLAGVQKSITDRIDAVNNSNFIRALMEILYETDTKSKLSSATLRIIAKYAALYFFAKHPEIDLRESDKLKQEDLEEVKETYSRILPFMEKAMKEAQKKKEFLSDWQAFKKFVEAENPIENEQEKIKDIVHITAQSLEEVDFSLDKLNANAWSNPAFSKPTFGEDMQLNLDFSFGDYTDKLPAVDMAGKTNKKKGKLAPAVWGIRFDFDKLPKGVTIPRSKELNDYDRHVHDAVLSLYRAGAKIVSLNSIYHAMGRRGTPGKDDREKINISLTKMRSATIYIDTTEEVEVNKSYTVFHYDGALLPFERVSAVVNGKEVKTAIKVLEEPPLGRFAYSRGQYTKFPLSVWAFPLSLTNTRLRIAHYLAEYISHLKNNSRLSRKLTFPTVFEKCGANTKMQRARCREIVKELVNYWRDDCVPAFLGKDSLVEKEFIFFDTKGKYLRKTEAKI